MLVCEEVCLGSATVECSMCCLCCVETTPSYFNLMINNYVFNLESSCHLSLFSTL